VTPADRFERCLAVILKYEGGYSDLSADPGGATNLGITLKTLIDWRGGPATKADVKALTVADVEPIYDKRYWRASACDKLSAGVDLMVFDLAVNSGPQRARCYLQQASGTAVDGIVGPNTLAAVQATGARSVIEQMHQLRSDFYRALPTYQTFGRGWNRRLEDVTTQALRWAAESQP
jgi:lysozyme family protein